MCSGVAVGEAGTTAKDREESPPLTDTYTQSDQPEGVPPLELTGERTLPDVPEENYWYRRHLVVYEWITARVAGLEVVDLACGEGYGSSVLARSAAGVIGVDANPEAFAHASAKYSDRQPQLPSGTGRELRRAARRRRLPADDRAHRRARTAARRLRPDRPRQLHLDPESADDRARWSREVGKPLARQGVPARGVPGAARTPLLSGRGSRPLARPHAQGA